VTTSAVPEPESIRAPAPSASAILPRHGVCLDCGSVLNGKFCSVCGQKDEPLKRGLKDLAKEFFQHPLIDTKLWRSLVPLLLRPGALTEEYLAGRRTRYVRPLKLYLTISVVFFAVFALRVPAEKAFKVESTDGTRQGLTQEELQTRDRKRLHFPGHWLDERFQRNSAALEGPEGAGARRALSMRIAGLTPKLVFIFLPLSAVLFKLFWWRRYFVEHLVFTLHLHSYAFASGLLLFLDWAPVTGVYLIWTSVYSALAFKRVYRQGWGKTVAKLAGLSFAYFLLLTLGLVVASLAAIVAT
jgi:hypothetical protein